MTDEDIDALLAKGESRTKDLAEKIKDDTKHSLATFSMTGDVESLYKFEGQDYSSTAKVSMRWMALADKSSYQSCSNFCLPFLDSRLRIPSTHRGPSSICLRESGRRTITSTSTTRTPCGSARNRSSRENRSSSKVKHGTSHGLLLQK